MDDLTDKDNPPEAREGFVWVWDDRAGQWVERGLPPLLTPRTTALDNGTDTFDAESINVLHK